MDWKRLFDAVKSEIKRRKLNHKQIAELANVNIATFENWLKRSSKPEGKHTVKSFLMMIDMLNINLDDFANHNTLGGRFELLRWKNKLSIAELAKKSNVGEDSIQKIEFRGHLDLKTTTLEKLAATLNTTVDYLLKGELKPIRNGLMDMPKKEIVETQVDMFPVDEPVSVTVDDVVEAESELMDEPVEVENTKPLVPIVLSKIGDQEVNSVSARDLYLDLGLAEAAWSKWSKANIVENEFLTQVLILFHSTKS